MLPTRISGVRLSWLVRNGAIAFSVSLSWTIRRNRISESVMAMSRIGKNNKVVRGRALPRSRKKVAARKRSVEMIEVRMIGATSTIDT